MSFTAEVIQGTIPATGTTLDLTFTGFGTPTAALFFGTRDRSDGGSGTTETDPPDDHAILSIGATDGTNQKVVTTIGEDNVLVSDGYHWDKSGQVLRYLDGTGAVATDLSFNSWITDGVRVNLDTLEGTAMGFTCVLIKCDAAFVGTFDTKSAIDDVTTDIGARVVFAFSGWSAVNDTAASAGHRIGYGWCGKQVGGTIQQMAASHGSTDAASGSTSAWDNHSVDELIREISQSGFGGGTKVTAMDADSVTFSKIGTGTDGSFLALDIGATTETWQDQINIPTANTNLQDFTQPGFLPKLVSIFGTRSNSGAWDTVVVNANAGTHCLGIGTGTGAANQKSHYIHAMDNRPLGPTKSITGNVQTDSINFQGHHEGAYSLGDDTIHCDLDTLHSTGFKLQWISNPASVRHFGFFAIEDDPAASGTTFQATGTAANTSDVTGAATRIKVAAGSTDSLSLASGVVGQVFPAAGIAASLSLVSGAIGQVFPATGTTTGTSLVTGAGDLIPPGGGGVTYQATGSADSLSLVSGAVRQIRAAAGVAGSLSGATGAAIRIKVASGTAASASLVSGSVGQIQSATGSISSASLVSGFVGQIFPAGGSVVSISLVTGSGDLIEPGGSTYQATGTIASNSLISGSVAQTKAAAGSAASNSLVTGSVGQVFPGGGTSLSASTVTGSVGTVFPIAGSVVAASTVTGLAGVTFSLSGTIVSASSIVGSIVKIQSASGTIVSASLVSGAVGQIFQASATVVSVSGMIGTGSVPSQDSQKPQTRIKGRVNENTALKGRVNENTPLKGEW